MDIGTNANNGENDLYSEMEHIIQHLPVNGPSRSSSTFKDELNSLKFVVFPPPKGIPTDIRHTRISIDPQTIEDHWSSFESKLKESRELLYNESTSSYRPVHIPISVFQMVEKYKLDTDQGDTF